MEINKCTTATLNLNSLTQDYVRNQQRCTTGKDVTCVTVLTTNHQNGTTWRDFLIFGRLFMSRFQNFDVLCHLCSGVIGGPWTNIRDVYPPPRSYGASSPILLSLPSFLSPYLPPPLPFSDPVSRGCQTIRVYFKQKYFTYFMTLLLGARR